MKITLELPAPLYRKAEATAAQGGLSFKEFVTQALRNKLAIDARAAHAAEPEWMKGFGELKRLRKETARVQMVVDQEFGVIEPEDRA